MKKILSIACLLVLLASTGHAQELFRSLTEILHSGVSANATGKIIKVEGWATVSVHVSGITTATVTFQVSNDAALGWHDLTCTKSSDGTSASSLTANGAVSCPVSGYRFFKAPISGYSAGTITVKTVQTTAASRGGGGGGSGVASSITGSDTLPAEPCANGQVYAEDTGGAIELYKCSGNAWVVIGADTATWASLLASGSLTTSESTRFSIRGVGGQSTSGWDFFQHSDGTPTIIPICSGTEYGCDTSVVIGSGQFREWADSSGNTIFKVLPGGATMKDRLLYGTNFKPLKSVWFGAVSLSTDGTQCADPTEATINSGPKLFTIICTDNDASTIYGSTKMPDSWDGGTVTFTHSYIQTAANTSPLNGDIAAQCRGNGEAPSSTWGTEVAIDDAGVTGSNQNDFTTSAAVTPAGTCAAGDMLYWRYQLDAAGTTTAVATLHHLGFLMEYAVSSWSD